MRFIKTLGHLFIIILLTVVTQIGGIIWLVSLLISVIFGYKKRLVFPLLYLVFNIVIIPPIAKSLGRESLPVFSKNVKPVNWFYPLAFRNYVSSELNELLDKASKESHQTITYLDANFPFIDGFPLLPHLSHNDGNKIDIAFQYKTETGKSTHKKPALLGYGIFTSDNNKTASYCKKKGYWQYGITKYIGIAINKGLKLDKEKTKLLLQKLLSGEKNSKAFIEPYLKQELGLQNYSKIRFHGCHAVRHDDHIHFEIID